MCGHNSKKLGNCTESRKRRKYYDGAYLYSIWKKQTNRAYMLSCPQDSAPRVVVVGELVLRPRTLCASSPRRRELHTKRNSEGPPSRYVDDG